MFFTSSVVKSKTILPSWIQVDYLQGCQLCAVHLDPEGVQMFWTGVGCNAAALQGQGRLAHFVLALVLVEPQLAVLDETPAGTPLTVHQNIEVAWWPRESEVDESCPGPTCCALLSSAHLKCRHICLGSPARTVSSCQGS